MRSGSKRYKRILSLILAGLLCFAVSACNGSGKTSESESSSQGFSVGFGKADITPYDPVNLGSYGDTATRISQGYIEPLYAITVAITDENDEPVKHLTKSETLLDFYTRIGLRISFEKVPVLSMFFSIGAQLWLTMLLFLYLWCRRKTKLLLPVGAMLLYMFGNAFVPIVLLRYFGGIFLCHPMIAAFLLQPEKTSGCREPKREGRFGLGLSIVATIQKLHGQKYGVINHEKGVEFWFDIKKS